MYYARTLADHEALFVSRAKQRIIVLGSELSDEFDRNDVTNYKAELIVELQYAINALRSTDLTWDADQIQMTIDYYTQVGNLTAFGFREITFNPTEIAQVCDCDLILSLINNLTVKVDDNYDYLYNLILQTNIDFKAADVEIYNYINSLTLGGGSAVWSSDHTAELDLGGVKVGDKYLKDDSLEDALRELTTKIPEVVNFTFDTFTDVVEVGSNLVVTGFTWGVVGVPVGMKITDSEGLLINQAVSGTAFSPATPITYSFATPKTITWTISGDRMKDVVIDVTSLFRSYFNKETTVDDAAITVTEAKILASPISSLQDTSKEVVLPITTSNVEQGFIAVAKTQSAPDYSKWFVNDNNNSSISSGEFITSPIDVTVNGIVYSVYRWGYRTPLTDNLKLTR